MNFLTTSCARHSLIIGYFIAAVVLSSSTLVRTTYSATNNTSLFIAAEAATIASCHGTTVFASKALNHAPVAVDDTYSPPGRFASILVAAPGILANDNDIDGDRLTVQLVTGPSHGTLTLNSDGGFTYIWAPGWAAADTFTYRASDGTDTSNIATVFIQMFPNIAPVAVPDYYAVEQGQTLSINPPGVLANDTDADGDHLFAHIYQYPQHGSLNFALHGGFSYTPQSGFAGTDSFIYRADDGTAMRSNDGIVTITVNPTPSPTPTPTPTTVEFSAISFDIAEDTTFANLTVTRFGNLSGTTTVEFVTSDDTAWQSTDYTQASGLVVFESGQNAKTLQVLISEDTYVEGDESLTVTLRNPVGAILGSPSTTLLQIVDDDINAPASNPIDAAEGLVRQQYHDYLHREGDAGGVAYWTNEIESCGDDPACINARRTRVADAFFVESEFQSNGGFLQLVYQAAFNSLPSYNQYMLDLGQLSATNSSPKDEFLNRFVLRPEFMAYYPASLPATQFVDRLNANTENALTQSERDALVNRLINGTETRASVLRKVVENAVFVERQYNRSFVLTLYFALLRRDPDGGGFQFWLEKIDVYPPHSGDGQHSLFCAFLTSTEYQMRFSSVVTRSNADCGR